MTLPEWLSRRGATLTRGSDGRTWYVTFDGKPHYALAPVPVQGKYGCAIRQTENGRSVECSGALESSESAIHHGLETLGKHLGWI